MTVGTSYWSEGLGTKFPAAPDIVSEIPSVTYREVLVVEGTKRPDHSITVDGNPIPEFCYLDPSRWIYGLPLAVGANTFTIRATNFAGRESAPVLVSAARVVRTGAFATSIRLTRNGVAVSDKVSAVGISASPVFIAGELTFNFYVRGAFAHGDRIELFHADAQVGEVRVFAGRVVDIKETGKYPTLEFSAQVLDDGESVIGATYTGALTGETNGAVVRFLLSTMGIAEDKIIVPGGNRYTGPRSISDKVIWEIVREIQRVEGWAFRVTPGGDLRFEPDIMLYFHSWEFGDADILDYRQEENRLAYFNALRVVYVEPEDSLKGGVDALQEAQIPSKVGEGEGYAFFTGFDYQTAVEAQSVNSDVFFAVWTDKVDLAALSKSNLYLRYADSAAKISTFSQDIALRAFPAKNVLIGTFDLSKYKLSTNAPFSFSFVVQDLRGNYYAKSSAPFALTDTAAEERRVITAYGIQLEEKHLVASVDLTYTIATESDLPTESEEKGVVLAKSRQNNPRRKEEDEDETPSWSGQFLVEVKLEDVISSSIDTNLDLLDKMSLADSPAAQLVNCELCTREDSPYNIKAQVYGIRYHDPRSPLRRIDTIYFLFRYHGVRPGSVIRCVFDVFGQRIVSTGDYIDPTMIRLYMEDTDEIAEKGLVFGGTLASSYFTTKAQAANLGAKTMRNHSRAPVQRFDATIPFIAEIRPMTAIRWTSAVRGETTLLLVSDVSVSDDAKTMSITGYRYEPILEFYLNVVGAKTIGISRPDLRNDLLEVFDPGTGVRGLMRGKVKGRKYAGMFHVELDNPAVTLDNVKSQIDDLADGEAVLVGDYPGGGYIIVMRLDGDFSDMDDPVDEDELEKEKDDYLKVPLDDDSRVSDDRYDEGKAKPEPPVLSATVSYTEEFDGLVALTSGIQFKFNHPVRLLAAAIPIGSGRAVRSDEILDHFIALFNADGGQVPTTLEYDTFTEEIVPGGAKIKKWDQTSVLMKPLIPFGTNAKYKAIIENGGSANIEGTQAYHRAWNSSGYHRQLRACDDSGAVFPDVASTYEFTTEPVFQIQRVQHSSPNELILTLTQNITEGVDGLFDPVETWIIDPAEA